MKNTMRPGAKTTFSYRVPAEKTVPHLYPEASEFAEMPAVFATGFMVGLIEWTCMKIIEPHLEPGEGSLGVHIDVSHTAATVPGQTVTVEALCTKIDRRRIRFEVKADDGLDLIGTGYHERVVVRWDKFLGRVNEKARAAKVPPLG